MLQSLSRRASRRLAAPSLAAPVLFLVALGGLGDLADAQWRAPLPTGPPDLSTFEAVDEALDGRALLPLGATWRYFVGTEEPSEKFDWAKPGFDDSGWKEGASGFGYGGDPQATDLSEMAGQATTLYLRHELVVEDPTSFSRIRLEVPLDDGMIFFLNGTEEMRQHADEPLKHMPHTATATSERKIDERPVPSFDLTGKLSAGSNILAIQCLVHEDDTKSLVLQPRVWVRYGMREDEERARFETFSNLLLDPGDEARLAYLEGRYHQRGERYDKAIAPFFRAAQFDPGHELPWRRLRESHVSLGTSADLEERLHAWAALGTGTPALFDAWAAVWLNDLERSPMDLIDRVPAAGELPERGRFADAVWSGRQLAEGSTLRVDAGAREPRGENGSTWSRDRFYQSGEILLREPDVPEPEDESGEAKEGAYAAEASAEEAQPFDPNVRTPTRTLDEIDPLYDVPVAIGPYELRLNLIGGEREFHVVVDEATAVRNYRTSGTDRDVETLRIPVFVEDGTLDFDLIPISGFFPEVTTFEIVPLPVESFTEQARRWAAEAPGLSLARVQVARSLMLAGELRAAVLELEEAERLPGFRSTDRELLDELQDSLLPEVASHASVDDLVTRRDAAQVLEQVRSGAADDEAEARALYFEGRLAQRNGNFDEAIGIFEELVFGGSEHAEPFLRMAECLRTVDLYEEALGIVNDGLNSGVELNDELMRLWFTLELDDLDGNPWDVIARLREMGVSGTLTPVPTSESSALLWQWTPYEPTVTTWSRASYDASAWRIDEGGLGSGLLVDAHPYTLWNTRRLFARRVFHLPSRKLLYPHVRTHMDDAGDVYLNGTAVARVGWNTLGYKNFPLRKGGIDPGENVLGMYTINLRGESFTDAGIIEPLDDLYWIMDRLEQDGIIRMNWGGPDLTTADGRLFHADRFYGNAIRSSTDVDDPLMEIEGTEDDELYRKYRWWYGTELETNTIQIPIPNGAYRVTLHFCEVTPRAKEKPRAFNVLLEDQVVIEKMNVCEEAGFATPLAKSFETVVEDWWLDLQLRDKDSNSILSAIEIEPLD